MRFGVSGFFDLIPLPDDTLFFSTGISYVFLNVRCILSPCNFHHLVLLFFPFGSCAFKQAHAACICQLNSARAQSL